MARVVQVKSTDLKVGDRILTTHGPRIIDKVGPVPGGWVLALSGRDEYWLSDDTLVDTLVF